MKLFHRKLAEPTRRQRIHDDALPAAKPMFSYRSRRSQTDRSAGRQTAGDAKPLVAKTKRIGQFWLQRFGLFILLVAVAVSVVHFLALSSTAKVLPLVNDSNRNLLGSTATYQATADQLLGSSIWNRSKLTIDTAQLSRQLQNRYPELASVSVTLPLFAQQPLIYVEPAQPVVVLSATNGTFVIDAHGRAVARTSSSQLQNLPQLHDQSGLQIQLNRQALPTSDVRFIQVVLAQLSAKKFAVSGMVLPAATNELDVQLAGQPYFVKFNLQSSDPRGQAGTFLATLAALQHQNITPAKYVDVRVDGRAYYQ